MPDYQGSHESETIPYQAPNLYDDLSHDHPGPDHDRAHGLADEERHFFPVVNLDNEAEGAKHEIFDPMAQGYSILNRHMAYEESVDDLHKMDSDWPFKEHSINEINYEDPYDLAEVRPGG